MVRDGARGARVHRAILLIHRSGTLTVRQQPMLDRIRNALRGRSPEPRGERYGYAGQFFACYLHQDWPEESGSWEAAADLFLMKESPEHARRAVADLDRLLAETREEAELLRVLDVFCNAYDPAPL